MISRVMVSIESQIDQELRAFLAAVDEYQACSVELAASCKSGCFDIARARKAMSCQGSTVSQLQYPAVFTHRVGVQVDIDSDYVMKLKDVDEITKSDSKSSEDDTVPRSVDPLKWFGILVPEHLRNSQRTFSRGVEVNVTLLLSFSFFYFPKLLMQSAVGAASASVKLDRHYKRYLALMEIKRANKIP